MPFALLIVGSFLLVAGVRGTTTQLYALVRGDFSQQNGKPGFIGWMVAILIIGAIGYVKELQPLSRAFMALVIVVLILKNGGIWQAFNQQMLSSTPSAVTSAPSASNASGEIGIVGLTSILG